MNVKYLEKLVGYPIVNLKPEGPTFDYAQDIQPEDEVWFHTKLPRHDFTSGSIDEVRKALRQYTTSFQSQRTAAVRHYASAVSVAIFPIGYANNEGQKRAQQIAEDILHAYEELPLRVSCAKNSLPACIGRTGRLLSIDHRIFTHVDRRVDELMPFSVPLLVLNDERDYGSGCAEYALVAGEAKYARYIAIHELAHLLGLDDGYETFYPSLPNSELHLDPCPGGGPFAAAYRATMPQVYFTGNTYARNPVYTFTPLGNIMNTHACDKRVRNAFSKQTVFTPFQLAVMGENIQKRIHWRRWLR